MPSTSGAGGGSASPALSLVGPLPTTDDGEMGEDVDAAVGASGDEPAHPTTSTLANMSNTSEDFIRYLSLFSMADEANDWLIYEQEAVPLSLRVFRQREDVQSTPT